MNTQRLRNIAWACALCCSIYPGSAAGAEGFVRAGALYVDYTDSESSKSGASLAAGINWGAAQKHEASLEAIRADWSYHKPGGLAALPGTNGRGHLKPLLLNYRYYFWTHSSGLRVYAGGSVGRAKTSGEITVALSGLQYRGMADETSQVLGATLGVTGKLIGRVSYDLGYRYLHAEEFETPSILFMGTAGYTGGPGPVIQVPAAEAHCAALSLRFSF